MLLQFTNLINTTDSMVLEIIANAQTCTKCNCICTWMSTCKSVHTVTHLWYIIQTILLLSVCIMASGDYFI